MYKNDRTFNALCIAATNSKKCASGVKTVQGKLLRKNQDLDLHNLSIDENGLNTNEIKSGLALKRVYNVQNAEVVNRSSIKKENQAKLKKGVDKKRHLSPSEKAHNRAKLKKAQRKSNELEEIRQQRNIAQLKNIEKLQRIPDKNNLNVRTAILNSQERAKSSLDLKRNLEPGGINTKVWKILSQNSADLIQATDSITKNYIISVIKKYNRKGNKIPSKETQTSKRMFESNHDNRKVIRHALRRPLWQLAKASIKRSEYWTNFLEANNIVLENINIDKLDLSLIDLDALGIESKLLKRTITWLFK